MYHAKKAQRRFIQHERYTEMTIVKAAAVQISPVLYSREGTVEKIVEKIIALGHQGVQFATFPEAIVPYYPYFSLTDRVTQLDEIVRHERGDSAGNAVGQSVHPHSS